MQQRDGHIKRLIERAGRLGSSGHGSFQECGKQTRSLVRSSAKYIQGVCVVGQEQLDRAEDMQPQIASGLGDNFLDSILLVKIHHFKLISRTLVSRRLDLLLKALPRQVSTRLVPERASLQISRFTV